ncbi:hypothetical protein [Nocardia sp. CA-119907]|uniref:hypothetical protein n=1 Tax=Nocardia sp. CA-119907 TaxID=3239973 RepID=UPI003D97203A
MIFEVTVCDELPIYWGAEYPPNPDVGHLYVVLFDSGWIKVGRTCFPDRRIRELQRQYSRYYGWTLVQSWESCLVSNVEVHPRRHSDLYMVERKLIRYAKATSDGQELNPFVRGVGRDRTRPAETEAFYGCDFGTVRAYADVLARCEAVQ